MSQANARLTPMGRLLVIQRIQGGMAQTHVAAQMGLSRATVANGTMLTVLLVQPFKLLAFRRGQPRPDASVDLGPGNPLVDRLDPITELASHTLDRVRRGAQLLMQREHHPHRVLLLLRRIPPRRRLMPHICIHATTKTPITRGLTNRSPSPAQNPR